MSDIVILVFGVVIFAITAGIFWYCLQSKDGQIYRFANTEWDPYVAVGFCSGIALSFTMVLSSLISMLGT